VVLLVSCLLCFLVFGVFWGGWWGLGCRLVFFVVAGIDLVGFLF